MIGLLLLVVILSGCSTTNVKYQCADGSLKDSIDLCLLRVECQDNITEIEILKFQCFDGSIEDSIYDCSEIESSEFSQNQTRSDSFCSETENEQFEQITVKNAFEENVFMSKSDLYKYYPSLNEGWIGYYPVYILNTGCTKLETGKFSSITKIYLNNDLIQTYESEIFMPRDYLYPEEGGEYTLTLEEFGDRITYPLTWSPNGVPFKITSTGNYTIKATVYYDNNKLEDLEDIIVIS